MKKVFAVAAILVVAIASTAVLFTQFNAPKNVEDSAYVGVTYCGDSVENAKQLIDKVAGYTNLFVLQSGTLQRSLESVEEVGDYAISKGLYFLPYFGYISPSFPSWLQGVKEKWGTHLVGVYYGDEPGGKMLDDNVDLGIDNSTGDTVKKTTYGDVVVNKPDGVVIHYELGGNIHLYEPANITNYINRTQPVNVYATFYPNGTITVVNSDATAPNNQVANWSTATTYQTLLNQRPLKTYSETAEKFVAFNQKNLESLQNSSVALFTSDYALQWFDYRAGYDVVLTQVGWNQSLAQQLAVARGAAKTQSMDWGVFITWKYNAPPYLDSGAEIFSQMKTAYEAGAKYIVLFNYYENDENPYGTLQQEHFEALENFWKDVLENPAETRGSVAADAVLVLPSNFGCGLRWADDKIWGIFPPNNESQQVWDMLQTALSAHGVQLDIVYDEAGSTWTDEYVHVYCVLPDV